MDPPEQFFILRAKIKLERGGQGRGTGCCFGARSEYCLEGGVFLFFALFGNGCQESVARNSKD